MKLKNPSKYERVLELTQTFDEFNTAGRQFGKVSTALWTPNDEENTSGRMLPYIPEIVELMLADGIFIEVKQDESNLP